jgi:hypothetical protein
VFVYKMQEWNRIEGIGTLVDDDDDDGSGGMRVEAVGERRTEQTSVMNRIQRDGVGDVDVRWKRVSRWKRKQQGRR